MGGAMAVAGGAMAAAGMPGAMAGPGQRPTIRNPVVTLLLCFIPLYGIFVFYQMAKELADFTGDGFFALGFLIPCYNIIWLLSVLPGQVTKAKQMGGSQKPARGVILYLFVPAYALACDLNEVADPNWVG